MREVTALTNIDTCAWEPNKMYEKIDEIKALALFLIAVLISLSKLHLLSQSLSSVTKYVLVNFPFVVRSPLEQLSRYSERAI